MYCIYYLLTNQLLSCSIYKEYDNGSHVALSISKDNLGWLIDSAPLSNRLFRIIVASLCKWHTAVAQSLSVNPLCIVGNSDSSQSFLSGFSKNICQNNKINTHLISKLKI